MQVNFLGIKNAGYETRRYIQKFIDKNDNDKDFDEIETEHFLNVQLTDDSKGNDLTEFRDKVRMTGLRNFSHPLNPDMLSLTISKDVVKQGYSKTVDYQVYINEANKELEVNDNNLQMFSYLAKLLNRIAKAQDDKMIVDSKYLDEDAAESVILGEDLKNTYGKYYPSEIRKIHSPEVVKKGASTMASLIQDIMMDYFNN